MTPDRPSTAGDALSRDHVGSLEKGLAVLETLATARDGMTLTEVAERNGLTRAGARRLLLTLVATGHARQEGRHFLLTPRLLTLARNWLDGVSLWDFALPFMRELALELSESCSAAILADTDVVYVARVPGERIMSVSLNVGTRLPAWCTSMGRVLLSGVTDDEVRGVLARSDIKARTPKSQTDMDRLVWLVRQAGRGNHALVDEELEIGLRSLAVPVRDRAGRMVAAINVPAQSARISADDMLRRFLPPLQDTARRIEGFFALQ